MIFQKPIDKSPIVWYYININKYLERVLYNEQYTDIC